MRPAALALLWLTASGLTLPARLEFGDQAVGASGEPVVVRMANETTQPITVGVIIAAGDYRVVENACSGRTLAPEHACGVEVVLKPKSEGECNGTLFVATGGSDMKQTVALHGTGVAY